MEIPSSGDSRPLPENEVRRCDVLVVGAGPAGSSAARALARRGLEVVLADQRPFPRDKVCGDGLISDALAALAALGLRDRVARHAVAARELRVFAPNGDSASLDGDFACVPRETLDRLLCEGACEAGARFLPHMTAVSAIERDGRVAGAVFKGPRGAAGIEAAVTVLATGANAVALGAFGLDAPMQSSAVAGRAYFEAPADLAAEFPSLIIAYDEEWCPGYGWIFPSPGNRFNVGVGLFAGETRARRLRTFWEVFTRRFPPAAAIVRASTPLGGFRGAPMRTGLAGATFGRPGLLVAGEAAAVTYAATGEGIGKAMESGLLAADFAAETVAGQRAIEALHHEYEAEFRRRFTSRYQAYSVGQRWASHPFMLNLLAARVNRGRFAREELEALISERGDARRLFSPWGVVRALLT